MRHILRRPLAIILILLLTAGMNACSTPSVEQYTGTTPELNLRTFFNGSLTARGMLQNRAGVMTRRFTASIEASWQGNTGTLIEHFIYDDGEEQDRTWLLTLGPDGAVSGTAGDVIGTASGAMAGWFGISMAIPPAGSLQG